MNKNINEWSGNDYQPGLFTFYLEQAEKGHISKQFHPPKFKFQSYNPFFQAPIHFNKQQRGCRPRDPQNSPTHRVQVGNRGHFSQRKLERAKNYTEPCADENLYASNTSLRDDNKPCIRFNKNNINHFFNFDLRKNRAQVGLHKAQNTNSHRQQARYQAHSEEASGLLNQETKDYLKVQSFQQKNKDNSLKKAKSMSGHSQIKFKSSSFQKFYQNRQKTRIALQQSPKEKGIESVLQRFIQISKQKIHHSSSIREKQG